MELHELQSMFKRLQDKTKKTKQDQDNIDMLEELIFDAVEVEVEKNYSSYGQEINQF